MKLNVRESAQRRNCHMQTSNQNNEREGSRWLRIALLALTVLGPFVNPIVERLRQRSQELQNTAVTPQTAARQRLDELTQASRQLAAEQSRQLQEQARQLQAQAVSVRGAVKWNDQTRLKGAGEMRKGGEERRRQML